MPEAHTTNHQPDLLALTKQSWHDMLRRSIEHPNYTERSVCWQWMVFDNFLLEMGIKPSKELTIERINNSLGYFKDNCKWDTRKNQARNRSTTKLVVFKEQSKSIGEWAEITGLSEQIIWGRLKTGWSVEHALTTPKIARGQTRTGLPIKPNALQNQDIANQRFGSLTALYRERQGKMVYWICQCDCGRQTRSRAIRLIKNETTACRSCSKRKQR